MIVADRGLSIAGTLLGVVLDLLDEHEEGSLPIGLVVRTLIDRHGDEFDRPIASRYVAGILRKQLSIRLMKSMGVTAIPRSEESRIRQIAVRYGIERSPASQVEGAREIGTSRKD